MHFQYIGDDFAPKKTTVFGYNFELNGQAVDVTNSMAIGKLRGNASFIEIAEVVKEKPTTYDVPVELDLSELSDAELDNLEALTAPEEKEVKKGKNK